MRNTDLQYKNLLENVLANGHTKTDRTGTGTISITGAMMKFDLQKEFPILTTKKVYWKGVVAELLMFIRGYDNDDWLREQGVNIWREWPATDDKYIPYGAMWRSLPKYLVEMNSITTVQGDLFDGRLHYKNADVSVRWEDQLGNVINLLKTDPDSRRILVNCWQAAHMDEFVLAPCHNQFQFTSNVVDDKRVLNCVIYQRSCDALLGLPFNIASYALLTHIIAKEVGMEVGELTWMGGDVHIYNNHLEQVKEQLTRSSKSDPKLGDFLLKQLDEYEVSHFTLEGYDPHPAIKAPVAV